jgi:4-carboxymuconolactone decarboxylase
VGDEPRLDAYLHANGSVDEFERTLSRLTIADEAFIESLLPGAANLAASALDPKSHALVRLAAMIAADAAPASYLCPVESAQASGATDEELVGCLVAVISVVGPARVVAAAPKVGLALGYDVAAALEESGLPSI